MFIILFSQQILVSHHPNESDLLLLNRPGTFLLAWSTPELNSRHW